MKRLVFAILLLAWIFSPPGAAVAGVKVGVTVALPPPILFPAPPMLVVLPETQVYVAPDIEAEIYFHNGWWWRPWGGRWYRSRYYDSGWAYHRHVPAFYGKISPGWRNDYREHRWRGREWTYERIPHERVQRGWKGGMRGRR